MFVDLLYPESGRLLDLLRVHSVSIDHSTFIDLEGGGVCVCVNGKESFIS